MSAPKMFTGPRVLRACLAVFAGCLLLPPGPDWCPMAAAEPPAVIVRGRRIPVLPRRVARMEARGEIVELRPQPPVVIVEQAPPVVIRERVTEGLAGRLPARLSPPAEMQAARPFRPRGIEPATAIAPEAGRARAVPAAPQPQPPFEPAAAAAKPAAEQLPPIELLPTP
jgi:hypothetical protein